MILVKTDAALVVEVIGLFGIAEKLAIFKVMFILESATAIISPLLDSTWISPQRNGRGQPPPSYQYSLKSVIKL